MRNSLLIVLFCLLPFAIVRAVDFYERVDGMTVCVGHWNGVWINPTAENPQETLRHEWRHVEQIEEYGCATMWYMYYAGMSETLERDARSAE